MAQVGQRPVRVGQLIAADVGFDGNCWRDGQELASVLTGEIRHGSHASLLPQETVRKCRNVAHVDAGAHDGAAGRNARERFGNEAADRREDDRRVERAGRRVG